MSNALQLGDLPDPFALAADLLDPQPMPAPEWARAKLDVELWSKQREITEALENHPRVAVRSCHDSGKSFTAGVIASHWIESHPVGTAFVISTAPTWPQVRAILWREIGRLHRAGNLRGRVNQTEWWIGGEMVAFGRKPNDYDPDAFQGIHAQYVLVILDEANGIPLALWDAAETLITNKNSRILAIGNPDSPQSQFAKVCKPSSGWHTIKIAAADTPNFTGERVRPVVSDLLLSPTWVEDKRHTWGESSPLFISKVLAEFPDDAEDGVVPVSWVWSCTTARNIPELDQLPIELGVDVGGGGDLTVIRERRGLMAGRQWTDNTPNPEQGVDKILLAIRESGATAVKIDVIGVGYGVAGWLEKEIRLADDLRGRVKVVKVNVANSPTDKARFHTLRDELWWTVGRELCDPNGTQWYLGEMADRDDAIADLVAPRYDLRGGKIKVEAKADTIKRIGHSPDKGDALLLAFYGGSKRSKAIRSSNYAK